MGISDSTLYISPNSFTMLDKWLSVLLTTAPLALAQTYSGFTVDISTRLDVLYGNISINNGQQLPRQDVLSPPNVSAPSDVFATGRAVLIMMDSDVPRNGSRVNLLHWLVPDVTGVTDGLNSTLLDIPQNIDIPYIPPTPPQGDYPHRYSFLLYAQPDNFSIPSNVNAENRVGFNLTSFLSASGLQNGLAANYMLVANVSGPATTSFPPPIFTASSTLAPSALGVTSTASSGGSFATEVSASSAGAGTGAGATTSAGASGSAATEPASSTGEGSVLRAGSGVALLAAVFGVLLM